MTLLLAEAVRMRYVPWESGTTSKLGKGAEMGMCRGENDLPLLGQGLAGPGVQPLASGG